MVVRWGCRSGRLQQQTPPPRPGGWRLRHRGRQGWLPLRPLSWVGGRPSPPVSSHGHPSGCVCVPISSSYKDPSPVGSGPLCGPHFTCIPSAKTHSVPSHPGLLSDSTTSILTRSHPSGSLCPHSPNVGPFSVPARVDSNRESAPTTRKHCSKHSAPHCKTEAPSNTVT